MQHNIDPGDIAMIVEFDAVKNKTLTDTDKKIFLVREAAEASYYCHAFPIPVFPDEDPRYVATKETRDHWTKWFTRDRNNNDKGIIYFYQLSQEYLEELTKQVERR
jgi:hypothetical protein